ncbi:regulator of Ty1 transposition protein [Ceratobasidium sp. AG-Ba]|nr:regulator of Ty1 transposition protein [Ceratobasidium sp. AG-Ba]
MSTTLRDFVASELGKLPGSRALTLHVLLSSPQRELELFPYSKIERNQKINSQNILLLVAESSAQSAPGATDPASAPRIFVAALEATLYLFPGTSSSILYIGKIDTTGFSQTTPSPARTLARATIDYYSRSDTRPPECGQRVWVHLFARAQSQYLFPDSSLWKAKRVLGDAGLVRWWWSLLGDVARDVASSKPVQSGFEGTKLWYILPGFAEVEAYHTLSSGSSFKIAQSNELPWSYGHPYDDPNVTFPLTGKPLKSTLSSTRGSSKDMSIASLIPIFPDDPKARFMGEIASTTSERDVPPPPPKPRSPVSPRSRNVSSSVDPNSLPPNSLESPIQSPVKKRRRVDEGTHNEPLIDGPLAREAERNDEESNKIIGSSSATCESLPKDTATASCPEPATEPAPSVSQSSLTSAPTKGSTHTESELVRRGRQALEAVSAQEFWERMGFRQECALGAVTAFFVAVFENPSITSKLSDTRQQKECIPLPTHIRITQTLMNHAFSTTEKAIRSTQMLESTIRTLCDGASSATKQDEEENSPDTTSFYHTYIFKSITVDNPALVPREPVPIQPQQVNVLQVKRKVRR